MSLGKINVRLALQIAQVTLIVNKQNIADIYFW